MATFVQRVRRAVHGCAHLALLLAGPSAAANQGPAPAMPSGPGPVEVDHFHPDRARPSKARRGSEIRVHTAALPRSLNYLVENSAVARAVLEELHEPLLKRDWTSWEWRGVLASSWSVEDRLLLKDGGEWIGRASAAPSGWQVRVADREVPVRVEASAVERVEPQSVWTFQLRPNVRWHDGHAFDARDVLFSYRCTRNPEVHCDRKRYLFEKIERAEALDALRVRFVFARRYFLAPSVFDASFTILPAHLYDLSDPDHPAHQAEVTDAEQGRVVNENVHNRDWVGLGPYRLEAFDAQSLTARRWDGYFDAPHGGWADVLRWRAIPDTKAAFQAVLAGELDLYDRLSAEEFFGAATQDQSFTSRAYTAWNYTPYVGATIWNTQRAALADVRVRRALDLAFDWDTFARDWYRGAAQRAASEVYWPTPACDRSLAPTPCDPEEAARLLAEAGWYDRDGDGWVDRDGQALAISLVYPAGNETSQAYGLLYQEHLARLGVRLELSPLEFAALSKQVGARDFDAAALGWVLEFERDPEPLWHSRWSQGNSANRSSLADAEVDRLIESIQTELDASARIALEHRLQRRIAELHPVQFGLYVPRRLAIAKRLRGLQLFSLDPGYALRDVWVDESPR